MKILLVTHYYSTHRGGIEIVAGTLADLLARAHEIVWAASDCDPVPDAAGRTLRFMPMRASNAIERFSGLPFPLWGPVSLLRLCRTMREADVVHLHDFAYFGNWAAFACALLLRKPLVVTQHVGFIPYRNAILRLALRAMHVTAGRIVLGRADQVVFISSVVREYFARAVRFRRPPVVIANGVDTETFVPALEGGRDRARASLGLDPSRPVLLFVGRFVEKKGLHILQALVSRLPEVSWVFAGWGPLDPRGWKAPNVHVFGDRRAESLVPLYQAADLLVLPSVGEGLPLVIQESMSCGTPVLTGEDTAQAVDAPAGLVSACRVGGPETADAWETSVRTMLAERPNRRAVAEFARARWSWPAAAEAYASVIEGVTAGPRPPAATSTRCA